MITSRRSFLIGALSVLSAPAIVKSEFIMPIKSIEVPQKSIIKPGDMWFNTNDSRLYIATDGHIWVGADGNTFKDVFGQANIATW